MEETMGKNIIICFDGTCNHPSDAHQEREWLGFGDIEDSGITNILKLHVMFGGDLQNKAQSSSQHSLYYSGVGTYGNFFQRIFNAGLAPANLDVGRIIKNAGRDLAGIYTPDDQISIFGFSRGAAIARRFATVIDQYIAVEKSTQPIRFLGVFDTVASIGLPNLDDDEKPVSDVVFENGTISPFVQEALHLLALDENRTAFMPTLMNKDKRVTEVWFPGAHSDVGGGFWYDGLSDVTLDFMLSEIARRNIGLDVSNPRDVDYTALQSPRGDYRVDLEDVFLKPNHRGKSHPRDRWLPVARATFCVRDVRINIDDRPSPADWPLIHCSVVDRIRDVLEYRPKALKGVPHRIVAKDDSHQEFKGIIDHILE